MAMIQTRLYLDVWENNKLLIWKGKVDRAECLIRRTVDTASHLSDRHTQTPTHSYVRRSLAQRARMCPEAESGHFEHLLQQWKSTVFQVRIL
jgi:hypothetical protein